MISYIGGKYRMAKWIEEYIPKNISLYAEIFGGAFWTYLKSDIYKINGLKEVHYNDFNRLMTNMFECSRNFDEFEKSLIAFARLGLNVMITELDSVLVY